MMNIFRVVLFFVLASVSCAHATEDARIAVVQRLYQDYAWETEPGISKRTTLFSERSSVLRTYLTQSLSRLVLEDQQCSERTGGICNLDFVPIWNSQDPEGAKFRVVGTSPSNAVAVEITYPGRRSVTLTFDVVSTEAGWRINDIRSPAPKWSLRKILSRKP
jgi:hypothetical protein